MTSSPVISGISQPNSFHLDPHLNKRVQSFNHQKGDLSPKVPPPQPCRRPFQCRRQMNGVRPSYRNVWQTHSAVIEAWEQISSKTTKAALKRTQSFLSA